MSLEWFLLPHWHWTRVNCTTSNTLPYTHTRAHTQSPYHLWWSEQITHDTTHSGGPTGVDQKVRWSIYTIDLFIIIFDINHFDRILTWSRCLVQSIHIVLYYSSNRCCTEWANDDDVALITYITIKKLIWMWMRNEKRKLRSLRMGRRRSIKAERKIRDAACVSENQWEIAENAWLFFKSSQHNRNSNLWTSLILSLR